MALDQISNWTMAMADNLTQTLAQVPVSEPSPQIECLPTETVEWTTPAVYLPDEILLHILEHILLFDSAKEAQYTLSSACLLSHQWYHVAIPLLYARPQLYGKNYDPFVRTMCPSINPRVRESPLSSLVKELNMASLVHQGSKSMTARLLGRVKGNVEVFVAPVASFALNCLAPLARCSRLRTLDLSLVSESPPLYNLLKTTAHLENLATLRLPRSSGFGGSAVKASDKVSQGWPLRLRDLSLSGGIDGFFLNGVVALPNSLRKLTIEHCPLIKNHEMANLLQLAVAPLPQLTDLTIRYLPRLSEDALNDVLLLLPQLRRLSISVDYIGPAIFDHGSYARVKEFLPPEFATAVPHKLCHANLYHLELTTSTSTNIEDKISPVDISYAIDEGSLPALRQVRVSRALLWHGKDTKSDAEDLANVLQEASRRDWENGEGVFRGTEVRRHQSMVDGQAKWERVAGVWMFDDNSR